MSKTNVGTIGVGRMGTYHAQIYQKLPQVELCALCKFSGSRGKELGIELPGTILCRNYKELLRDAAIEALSIVFPDNLYREVVELAVQAGEHILLERPLAKELEDGKTPYEITKDYDKVSTTGSLFCSDPHFVMVEERLDSNELGGTIHCYMRRNSPIIGPWHYIDASDLSMHVIIHNIDYIDQQMDRQPVKVSTKNRSMLLKESGMSDAIYILITYGNGAVACMEACWMLPENSSATIGDKVELVGIRGTACVDSCDHGACFVTGRGVQCPDSRHWYYVNGEVHGGLTEEVVAFVNNVAVSIESVIAPKQSYDALQAADAIERSIMEGKEVTL